MNTITEEVPENVVTITETELILVLKIISIVSTRGGFKAEELKTVGSLYERFLSMVKKTDSETSADSETVVDSETK